MDTDTDMHSDPARQLAALCAQPQTYTTTAGEAVEIAPIRVRQLAAAARAAEPVFGELAALSDLPKDQQGAAFIGLLMARIDDVSALVAALVNRPAQWVGDLALDDLAGLAGLAIEVNADFFVHRLRPTIESMGAAMARGLGSMSPPAAQVQAQAGSVSPPG